MVRKGIFISTLILFALLLTFNSSSLWNGGTASAQDPNATLPTSKKATPKKSVPPPKKTTPPARTSRTLSHTRTNQAGIEFVLIPAGSFMMGSTNGGNDEKPVHQVTINYSFYLGKDEVAQAQWQSVMGNNPSWFKACGGNCPVEEVSWEDAQKFIQKLNQMNDGYIYRLPTETEWEYACRAGTTGDYAGELDAMAWYRSNSGSRTHPVGLKQANGFGLYDMHGNVSEWCEDLYHDSYVGAPADGRAWLSGGKQEHRVMRGGEWGIFTNSMIASIDSGGLPETLRSASRSAASHFASARTGFRVVAVLRAQ